jgi:hypothetical protein
MSAILLVPIIAFAWWLILLARTKGLSHIRVRPTLFVLFGAQGQAVTLFLLNDKDG